MSSRLSLDQYHSLTKARKPNKFGAKEDYRCEACGSSAIYGGLCKGCGSDQVRRFDSKAEARRYDDLRIWLKAGRISDLACQTPYPIEINGVCIGKYIADFSYCDAAGFPVVEDVKGKDTPLSKFKRKCVEAQYGLTVQLIRKSQ